MVRSKRCSTKRPDTLMQLSRSSLSEIRLAPRGRAIHLALLGPREMSDLSPQSGPKRTLMIQIVDRDFMR